jgi:F0F1-type ATP synthase assembly protein I
MSTFEQRLNRSRRATDLPPTARHSGVLPDDSLRPAQSCADGVGSARRGLAGDRAVTDLAWAMFSSVAAGILLYGGIGWLLDRWLGLEGVLFPIGVLVGFGLGTWLVFIRSNQSAAAAEAAADETKP